MQSDNSKALDKFVSKLIKNQPKIIDYDLKRIELVLSRIGSPQSSVKNIIHVAGTNGKGSTIANLKALLIGHGFSVNSFTSPHLIKPTERINLNGKDISNERLLDLLLMIIKNKREVRMSYFELLTCASFIAFKQIKSDFTLMEVGLGGRKDATNIIKAPIACLITPISLDHKEFLGDTISKIAFEKAGIIKEKTPIFVGRQSQKAMSKILAEADKFNCPIYEFGKDWTIKKMSNKYYVKIQDSLVNLDSKALKGDYQLENSALALATLHYLNLLNAQLSESCLASTVWPGRFQYLRNGILHDIATKANRENKIILDGAHNPSGAKAIANEIKINKWGNTYLILALQKNKDLMGFMKHFKGLVRKIFILESVEKKFLNSAEIRTKLIHLDLDFEFYSSRTVQSAIKSITELKPSGPKTIIITGSLYLIGKVLNNNM